MSIHVFLLEMNKLLGSLDGCLDKAAAHAAAKKFDPNVILQSRLAPDMFSFTRQVQAACDQAKLAAARLAGRDAPPHPNTEQSLDELKQRVATVRAYLDTFSAKDFEGVEDRTVTTPRWEGKSMTATNYFVEHAQPNFYFHLTCAYAILRHLGVEVGKRDYLGKPTWR